MRPDAVSLPIFSDEGGQPSARRRPLCLITSFVSFPRFFRAIWVEEASLPGCASERGRAMGRQTVLTLLPLLLYCYCSLSFQHEQVANEHRAILADERAESIGSLDLLEQASASTSTERFTAPKALAATSSNCPYPLSVAHRRRLKEDELSSLASPSRHSELPLRRPPSQLRSLYPPDHATCGSSSHPCPPPVLRAEARPGEDHPLPALRLPRPRRPHAGSAESSSLRPTCMRGDRNSRVAIIPVDPAVVAWY